ncbi:MAG: multidrug efflux RND transporter permease subunit [Gammaproteobacteria bacterium]|nr:MAG: multidrug efflux RND transporter permease subunit [Gammaproteobacteria bacterium]
MAKFFIDRPIFAWVVALFIIIAGGATLTKLPINQYPRVAAPTITVTTIYPGASAQTHEDAVLAIIEKEMNGIDGLDYLSTSVDTTGIGKLTLTFKTGTDEDIAQINVQNALSVATPRLPQSVRNNGIQVSKSQSGFLMIVVLKSKKGETGIAEIADYAIRSVQPELQRLDGVGNLQVFGAEQAMRIWLDPNKMRSYNLNTNDISRAISNQNLQIPAGAIGGLPALAEQTITAAITVPSQLKTPDEFKAVIVKYRADGSTVTLGDVARVEMGLQSYTTRIRLNGKNAVGMGVQLSTTGNAVAVAAEVRNKMAELQQFFPDDITWAVPYDTSTFVSISIEKVLMTLLEAVALVFIVMLLFLQNIRYTIIPTIVVPISLLGAIALMGIFGLSINVLTMFAMVLVIGIVVDDAIVVVENVERLMAEEGLSPRDAAHKGMTQITGAVIGITVVLIAVFVPLAFFPGASGNIYRQFSLVMVSAIGFSAFLALSLTPALCATLLKPVREDHHEKRGFFGWFNRAVKRTTHVYEGFLARLVRGAFLMMLIYAAIGGGAYLIYKQLPGSFLPQEDQGYIMASVQLPPEATQTRTSNTFKQVEAIAMANENVDSIVSVMGFSFSGYGQNMGIAFITLKDWAERQAPGQGADAIAKRLMRKFMGIRDGFIFALSPPPIAELGNSSGFDMRLEDRANQGHNALLNARNMLLGMAAKDPRLAGVRPSGLEDAPQLQLTINRDAAYAKGVDVAAIASVLETELGSYYVNDFPNKGRMQRVVIMADAKARMQPDDIMKLTVPNNKSELVTLSELVSMKWVTGPAQLNRYNSYPSMSIRGSAADGGSSGTAMQAMQELVAKLPPGFGMEWTGQSLEERRAGNMSAILYGFAMLAVFLCLAALYESWSIPFAVMLVVPLGFLGVVLGIFMRGMANDVYFQVGMITVIGLSAKNAILIVEFAKDLQAEGASLVKSVLQAAHLRFRPIVMTSMAFIMGVVPLYISTGAGSASQRAVGTSVFWGMLVGTFLAIFFVPIFYLVVRKIFSRHADAPLNQLKPALDHLGNTQENE